MWEVMLTQIRGVIIEFAKIKKRNENRREKDLIKQIKKIESKINENNMEQLDILNMELAQIREDRIKGAQIRARSIKLNEGEKPSAYFLSLEKANYINKTMLEIFNTKENLITNRQEILKTQKDFYQKLYKKGQTTDLERSDLHWVTQYVRKISNEKKLKLEQNINIEELEKVLFKTKNNKAPGPDGYS